MNKKLLQALLFLISLFTYSCANDDIEKGLDEKKSNEYFVTQEKAKEIASSVFKNKQAKGFEGKVLTESFPVKDENDEIVYYINNYSEGGFVILAADTRSIPVLAYSFDNNFDTSAENYPGGLVEWLVYAKNQIKEIRAKELPQPEEFVEMWNDVALGNVRFNPSNLSDCSAIPVTATIKEPLLQTSWNQTVGYNDNMPLAVPTYCGSIGSGNNRFYAGCVPVAIAQVIRYHEYPTNFNYGSMNNASGSAETRRLINDLHNKIYYYYDQFNLPFQPARPLKYRCDGTAVDGDFPKHQMLLLNYGYASASNQTSIFIPKEVTIMNNILNNQPVIMSGGKEAGWWIFKYQASGTGHMWVADGLETFSYCIRTPFVKINQTIMRYHMNWGWGSLHNAFYSYNNFNPGTHDFNYKVDIVHNIQKP